jgi:ribosomal protein L7/L12
MTTITLSPELSAQVEVVAQARGAGADQRAESILSQILSMGEFQVEPESALREEVAVVWRTRRVAGVGLALVVR